MRLLVIDTETTSADPTQAVLLEIAVALFDTTVNTTLWSFSTLVPRAGVSNLAAAINGISDAALQAQATFDEACVDCFMDAYDELLSMGYEHADYYVAYNASFDRAIVNDVRATKPWVCAKNDLRFPKQGTGQKLSYLAADHGIVALSAHRAMSDVQTLVALLQQCPDLEEQILESQQPRATYIACVPYERKNEAKLKGFAWHAASREWIRVLTEKQLLTLREECAFKIVLARERLRHDAAGVAVQTWVKPIHGPGGEKL